MPQIMSAKTISKPYAGFAHASRPLRTMTHAMLQLCADLQRRRRARMTRRILEGLDDRTLHDIGVHRSQIGSVVGARGGDHRVHYDHLY